VAAETFRGVAHSTEGRLLAALVSVFVIAYAPGLAMAALRHGEFAVVGVAWWVFVWLAWRIFRRLASRITVGSDGMLLHGWPRARFVSWRDVSAFRAHPVPPLRATMMRFDVILKSGEVIGIHASAEKAVTWEALLGRARELLHAYQMHPPAEAPVALPVARAGRSAADWLRGLRGMTRGADDYRSMSISDETLGSIVEDPRAEASARAGAAAALAGSPDAHTRVRLRVAADASVSPVLNRALVRIAEADADAGVERALGSVAEGEFSP
jgi:hypothetical protein